jgi:hypothetical protein
LGEISRIGEIVVNSFLGPRFKAAMVTIDLPLVPDKPIDFGLQDFCSKCGKCARGAPQGRSVMLTKAFKMGMSLAIGCGEMYWYASRKQGWSRLWGVHKNLPLEQTFYLISPEHIVEHETHSCGQEVRCLG